MHRLSGESSKPPRYREQTAAALNSQTAILSEIFSGPGIHLPFNVLNGSIDRCHRDDRTGRLLWIYRLPAIVFPPFIGNPCRTFILELKSDGSVTHAEKTEQFVRQKVGNAFVPKRILTVEVLVDKHPFNITVYESIDGLRNLSHIWKTEMRGFERKQVVKDLMEMKRTLCFVDLPSECDAYGGSQPSLCEHPNAPGLHMRFDLSRWNVLYDKECSERDTAVLSNAKPILSLLNHHIPRYCRGEAEVAKDGHCITLRLGDRSVVFTAQEMKYLRNSIFLHHKMAYPHDVFIQRCGKRYKVVAVLGWESAEYCPSGYGMGERDSMLGKEISDTAWYLSIRREGLSRRKAKNAACQPAQSKLADTVHLMHTYCESFNETREESEEASRCEEWLRCRKYQWKGGSVGWSCPWTAELENVVRDRFTLWKCRNFG